MEEKRLRDMIERFFNAELTTEEELLLCRFLYANEVPAELRKDKEAIIALCGMYEEIALPEGAAERLESMLDELEEMKTHLNPLRATLVTPPPCGHPLYKQRGSWARSFLLRVACAAAVLAIVFLAILYGDNKHTDEATVLTMVDDVDKDTFDNPEEAMQCLMAAYGDIQYAMNTTQRQTHEAYQTLEQSQSIIREMFNMNIN